MVDNITYMYMGSWSKQKCSVGVKCRVGMSGSLKTHALFGNCYRCVGWEYTGIAVVESEKRCQCMTRHLVDAILI